MGDFFVEDEQATVRGWLVDLGQGGDECEIERMAPSLEDGSYALRLEVVEGGQNARAEVLDSGPGDDQSVCMGLAMEGAEALLDASPGDVVCVSGSVHNETTCTQLACAGT